MNSGSLKNEVPEDVIEIPEYDSSLTSSPGSSNHLIVIQDKNRHYPAIKQFIDNFTNQKSKAAVQLLMETLQAPSHSVDRLDVCIEVYDDFERHVDKMTQFITKNTTFLVTIPSIAYHIHFNPQSDGAQMTEASKISLNNFLIALQGNAVHNVVHGSIIHKYSDRTAYVTEKDQLEQLGHQIYNDFSQFPNLKTLDYRENGLRFFPGVKFPSTLESLNIGGGSSLETLSGFKMPAQLKTLTVGPGSISSVENIAFPPTLENLTITRNNLYFINYVDFPTYLQHLDLSDNRIESLQGVNFPMYLKSLILSNNPIENVKGARFPEELQYLDISLIPNESMAGIRLPDLIITLNLQRSMTNIRGLKLPVRVRSLNIAHNGVNSVNPLKLPNSIEELHLGYNNIKTLNKVQFPTSLRTLYIGNNLITTLKNVQFPYSLEVLDMDNDATREDQDKCLTSFKDVIWPPNLKVLKVAHHAIRTVEGIDLPASLSWLSLAHNGLKVIRNVTLGNNLKVLDLSGNPELYNIDQLQIPESVTSLCISPQLLAYLPGYIVERANKGQLTLSK